MLRGFALGTVLLLCAGAASPASAAGARQEAAAADSAAKIAVIQLSNGTRLIGELVKEEDGKITFKDQVLGEVVVDASSVTARLTAVEAAAMAAQAGASAGAAQQQSAAGGVPSFAQGPKVLWTRTITAGGSFTSAAFVQGQIPDTFDGITGKLLKLPGDTTQAQLGFSIVGATMKGVGFVDGNLTYATYEPFGKQTDTKSVSGGYNFKLGEKYYGVTRLTWKRDKIKEIDYSIVGLAGVGRTWVETPKAKFDFVPGVTILQEKKGTVHDGDLEFGGGFLENLVLTPNPYMQIEQREMFYVIFSDTDLRGLESYVGLTGMLNKYLGLQFGLSHIYDNTLAQRETIIPADALFPGSPTLALLANTKGQTLLTAGLQIKF